LPQNWKEMRKKKLENPKEKKISISHKSEVKVACKQ
jgi:hypothetical protein